MISLSDGQGFSARGGMDWIRVAALWMLLMMRNIQEVLVNALVHRDYLVNGSEVHIDMFDDRMVIYSPGGMPDGTLVQERVIDAIPSTRRNPVLADVFQRIGYMERKGSGLTKIINAYKNANIMMKVKRHSLYRQEWSSQSY